MIDEEQIRLFNELMSTRPGEQTEGLTSRFPSVYEVPSISKPDPNAEKLKQILEGRKQLEEKQRQEEFAARPLPEKIEGAREAAGFLGSTIGRGMTYPFVELYGRATDQPALGESYLEGAELPKTDLGREYTIQTGSFLEPVANLMDKAKIPHTPFTVELLPLANMPFALSKTNIARAGQKAAEDVRQATKAATQVGTKAVETVQETLATPPVGAISLDTLGFSSRLSEGVDKLQDKGTGSQFLAQLSKMKGVPAAEIKVTGLDEYLKNTPKVTKQEVQDYLETNRLQLIEDERMAGAGRLDKEVIQYLPRQFDWLDRYDLDEEFIDKAHLRNHLVRTLDEHFDDLEAEADNKGGFHARDRSGEVRYIPASQRFEWREAEIDKIDDELSDLPDFNGATKYPDDYQIPGGENYREILYKLPDDKVEGVFKPPPAHFDNADNTFGSIRATDRTIDGTPTLFAEEVQSDWAIKGAKEGYRPKGELIKGKVVRQDDVPGGLLSWKVEWNDGTFSGGYDKATAERVAQLGKNAPGVPDNPFRGNWYKPVINNFLVKAAQEGKGGIGFPVGEIIKDRYNLANVVDRIESSTDRTVYPTPLRGGPFKIVTIDLKPALAGANEKQMSLRVDKDGLVRGVNADQYNRFIGKPLTEVVGKGVSEKILSNDSQVMTDLDLKIGGEGKDKLYDDMLPKHLNEIGKRYGVQLEKRTIPFSEGKKKESEVYFMPITEEMRNDILSEGLPMFKQGGSVKKFAPGGKVLKGISKGASEAAEAAQKARRTPQLEQFLEKSKVKEQMYRGQRRAPQATGFALTQGRGTPSFTTDPEVANVYSRQLGWGSPEYGPGSTVMPAYLQMENPLDIRGLGEYIDLESFVNELPNVDLNKPTVKDGFGYEDIAKMVRGIGSVANKTGAKYEIEASSPGSIFRVTEFDELADAIEELGVVGKSEKIQEMLFDTSIDAFLIGDSKNIKNALKEKGFDGVIHKDAFDVGGEYYQGDKKNLEGGIHAEHIHDSYRPFFQEKIKSSIGNVGEYDITNPDITKAKGGPIKSALEGAGKAAAEVKKAGKLTRLQEKLRQSGGEKQAQRLERAADEIPGLERLFHTRGLYEAFQGSEGYPYQGVVTMRPGDYKNWAQPLEIDLADGRRGISPHSVQNIEDLRGLIRRGRPFTSVPYLQLDKKGPLTIVSGHEGRHRTRAMEAEDMPATLVQVLPRHSLKFKDLRNPSPSEWRQKLSEAMGPEGLVLPESGMKLNPKFVRASELAKKASEERDWDKFGALDRELSRYYNEDKVKLPDLEMLTEFPEVYQKGGAVKSIVSGAQRAAKEGQKMLQGVYRGYTGERLEEPVLSTTPQRKVAEYYATRRAATRGEDPHVEMLMVDPFAGKEYGLALPIDEFNRELLTTRARAIAPSDVVERTQLKKKGGLACLSK